MANEVNFGYSTGKTLTFSVYTSAGVTRETGTSLTETPASSGLYLGTPTTIEIGDNVVIKEGTNVIAHGEYQPHIDETTIVANIADGIIYIYDERK